MPTYTYICTECGTEFDAERSMEDRDRFVACMICHKGELKRMITAPNLIGLPTRGTGKNYRKPGDKYDAPPLKDRYGSEED